MNGGVGYVHQSAAVNKRQKRVSNPLELELQEAMNCLIWELGSEPWSSVRAASFCNPTLGAETGGSLGLNESSSDLVVHAHGHMYTCTYTYTCTHMHMPHMKS